MPWCPKCRQEFVAVATRCPDCDEALVATLAPMPARASDLAPFLIQAPPGLLAEVAELLRRAGLPIRTPAEGIEIPLSLGARVANWLLETYEGELAPAGLRLTGRLDAEAVDGESEVAPPDLSVLRLGRAEVAASVESSVAQLRAILASGDATQRTLAFTHFVRLARDARLDEVQLLLAAVRAGAVHESHDWLRHFREQPPPEIARRVVELLPRLEVRSLRLALHALAQFPDREVARAVLPYLDHVDEEARAEADDVLCSWSGRDFGFDAAADPATRARTIRQWREWIERERD